jgi:hypothetical protein
MSCCNLRDSCFFYNNELKIDMPQTTEYLRDKYCTGCFSECAIYMISKAYGKDKVPKYLFPNDLHEFLNFDLFEPHGGLDMFIKVIYSDGSAGMVRSSTLGNLTQSHEIVALQCSEGWVELRRTQNNSHKGPERRVIRPS